MENKVKNHQTKDETNSQKKQFIITKRIAKHGSQSIIVIPRMLEAHLKPGTIAQLTINVIDNLESTIENNEVLK